ncbi:YidC/Oxa1 family membrane protein insertase [Fusibacter bizertensis]
MLDIIAFPLGRILKFIYDSIAFQNYGVAIVMFTILIKSVMLPLNHKQFLSTHKMKEVQPQIQLIQDTFKNDRERLNIEVMNIYKENRINPASGCLPILVQLPILLSLYYVISQPLKYMFGKSQETILTLYNFIPDGAARYANMKDISILSYFNNNIDQIINVSHLLKLEELINLNFLGINLGIIPSLNPDQYLTSNAGMSNFLILLIPILSFITSYLSMKYSSKDTPTIDDNSFQKSIQSNMLLLAPIMSGVIAFTVPAGLGLYWIISNIYQIFQQILLEYSMKLKNR